MTRKFGNTASVLSFLTANVLRSADDNSGNESSVEQSRDQGFRSDFPRTHLLCCPSALFSQAFSEVLIRGQQLNCLDDGRGISWGDEHSTTVPLKDVCDLAEPRCDDRTA